MSLYIVNMLPTSAYHQVVILNLINGTIETELAKWPLERQAEIVTYTPLLNTDFINDETFRMAWSYNKDTNCLSIDLEKARQITLDAIRIQRNELLKISDGLYIRAIENNIDLTEIKNYRQSLRDATNYIKNLVITEDDDKTILDIFKSNLIFIPPSIPLM